VLRTRAGYSGGVRSDPTYYQLGDHTETVQIDYDPSRISYSDLLAEFWDSHNPFQQSIGTQYLNIAFYHNDEQIRLFNESKRQLERDKGKKVTTRARPFTAFYLAEDYHQKYYMMSQASNVFLSEAAKSKLIIIKEFRAMYPDTRDLIQSTAAARINGFLGGYGSDIVLREEIETYGLSEDGKQALLFITGRKLSN